MDPLHQLIRLDLLSRLDPFARPLLLRLGLLSPEALQQRGPSCQGRQWVPYFLFVTLLLVRVRSRELQLALWPQCCPVWWTEPLWVQSRQNLQPHRADQ